MTTVAKPLAQYPQSDQRVLDRFQKSRNFSQAELNAIMSSIRTLRATLARRHPHFDYKADPHIVSFTGFGNVVARNNVMWALRYMLNPVMLYCSQGNRDQWEAVMYLHVRKGSLSYFSPRTESWTYNKRLPDGSSQKVPMCTYIDRSDVFLEHVQKVLDQLKQSITCISLGTSFHSWSSVTTVRCVDRIYTGSRFFGDFEHQRNAGLYHMYMYRKRLLSDSDNNSRVRDATGRDFTVGNMLHTFFELRNRELELNNLRAASLHVLQNIASLERPLSIQQDLINEVCWNLTRPTSPHPTAINAPLRDPPPSQITDAARFSHLETIMSNNIHVRSQLTQLQNFLSNTPEFGISLLQNAPPPPPPPTVPAQADTTTDTTTTTNTTTNQPPPDVVNLITPSTSPANQTSNANVTLTPWPLSPSTASPTAHVPAATQDPSSRPPRTILTRRRAALTPVFIVAQM